jgi:hypothetical protein
MPEQFPKRIATDADIDRYSTYVSKLAAITSSGDPAPVTFRTWFLWTYEAIPVLEKITEASTVNAA